MADTDILIQIETAYKSGGLEAAKKAIADAEKASSDLAQTNAKVAQSTATAAREFNNAQRAATALNAASNASRGSFVALGQVFESVGGKFANVAARLSLVSSAAVAGWQTGAKVFQTMWANFVDGAVAAKDRVQLVIAAMKGLNDSDLSRIRSEIQTLQAEATAAAQAVDRAAARREKTRDAGTAAKIADIESSISDPDARAKAIAALREGESRDIASDQARDALQKQIAAERALKGIDERISALESERAAAGESMREASRLSPTNPAFRARRQRFAYAETAIARELDTLTGQRESARQTLLDAQTDYSVARSAVATTRLQAETATGARVAEFDRTAANRAMVAGRLQSMISNEDAAANAGNQLPQGVQIQAGESAAALRQLLQAVQSGNEKITAELISLFSEQAQSQQQLMQTIQTLRNQTRNLPL
jgi:hypothetical protein